MVKPNKRSFFIKNINLEKTIKILLFLLTTILFYFVPYTHDDWAWGTEIGIERLSTFFYNYNGRWAGNLLVILLTRSRLLKAIFISLTMTIMVELINKIINKKNDKIIYMASVLIILMPSSIIAQTLAWTSGFTNYVISLLLILIFIYLNKGLFSNESLKISNKMIIPMLILGFISSLFMENLTIYNLVLGIFVLLYGYYRSKKINLPNIFYFLGSILGSILMFSNGAYHNVMNSTDGYRTFEQGNIIIRSIHTYFDTIYNYLIQNNLILNLLIGILALFLIYRFFNNNNISRTKKILLSFSTVVILGYLSYIIFVYVCNNDNIFITHKYKMYLEGIGVLIYWMAIIITSMLTIIDKNKKFRILFYILSIVLVVAPLFIVTPIGPRCFFPTYILFVMIAIELFDAINNEFELNIKTFLIIITTILILFYLIIFGYVFKIETTRNKYIENAKTDIETLYLPKLPFEKYMQGGNPTNETFLDRFKLFYVIEDRTEVVFIDYKEWKEKINNI